MTSGSHRGRCACGGVRYVVDGELRDVTNCHCARCRRVTGHHMAATAAAADTITVTGHERIRWWGPDESAEYAFCQTCGSTLFWRARATPEELSIAAGTLEVPTGLRTTTAWWVAEASDYHQRPAGVRELRYEE